MTRLSAAMTLVLKTPEARAHFAAQGREVSATTPDAFAAYIKAEYALCGAVIRQAGITAE